MPRQHRSRTFQQLNFSIKLVSIDSGIAEGTCKGLGKALMMHDECVEAGCMISHTLLYACLDSVCALGCLDSVRQL